MMLLVQIKKLDLDGQGNINVTCKVQESTGISLLVSGQVPEGFGGFASIANAIKNRAIQAVQLNGGPTYTLAEVKLIGPTLL